MAVKAGKKAVYGAAIGAVSLLAIAHQQAYAEGSFLLQLGTFATKEEATQKWQDVRSAHGDIVKKLKPHVAEVMLPPDNTPSYRTQIGPVNSRGEAKNICKQLQAESVQCLVVETAFAAADLSPEMSGEAPAAAMVDSDVSDTPAPKMETKISAEDAISSEPVAPVAQEAAPAPAPQEEKPGFFGRLFGSSSSSPASSAPASKVATSRAPEPLNNELSASPASSRSAQFNPADMKKSGFFRGTFAANGSAARASAPVAPVETNVAQAETPAASPKEEQRGFFGRLFGSSKKQPEPAPVETVAAAETTTQTAPATAPVTPAEGDVEVAEAIRVPVSKGEDTSKTVIETVQPAKPGERVKGVSREVGDRTARTYWAQISYFNSDEEARLFYQSFNASNPELFNDVRLRVTRPFASSDSRVSLRVGPFATKKDVKVVCAAARERTMRCISIRDIGNTLENYGERYNDEGRRVKPRRHASPLETLGMPEVDDKTPTIAASVVSDTGIGAKWLSVGGFHTAQEAWDYWKQTKSDQPKFAGIQSVITGSLGGDPENKFQLRLGPLPDSTIGESICGVVNKSGKSCATQEAP